MKFFELSRELWDQIAPHLPKNEITSKGGRPRLDFKKVFEGISFIKINNLPWSGMPEFYGSKTAINDYYRYWANRGVFHALRDSKILLQPELIDVDFDWDKIESLYLKTLLFSDTKDADEKA